MADQRSSGGERALLGFYYQMILSLGLGSMGSEAIPIDSGGADLLVSSFTTSSGGRLIAEEAGQDLTLESGSYRLLIQAKYSDSPWSNEFELSDLREVLRSFAYSLLLVDQPEKPSVCGCILITNRPPHEAIKGVEEIIASCRGQLGWSTGEALPLPPDSNVYRKTNIEFSQQQHPHNGPLEELIKTWLTINHRDKAPILPRNDLVNAALRLLPGLYLVFNSHISPFEEAFRSFAQRYGAQDAEIQAAQDQLIGRFLSRPGEKSLDLSDFVQAITGYGEAKELTPAGIGGPCSDAWHEWLGERDLRPAWSVPRPALLQEVDGALLEGKRIIFIVGRGGCGKTELLAQITSTRIDDFESDTTFQGYVALSSCGQDLIDWLERAVGRWANRGLPPDQKLDLPLTRLTIVNSEQPVLIWLGLDGLDEYPSHEVVKELISIARGRSDVRLFLTARGSEFRDVYRYLYPDRIFSPIVSEDPDVAIVRVGDFEDEETLLDAINKGTDYEVGLMVRNARSAAAGSHMLPMLSGNRPILRFDPSDYRTLGDRFNDEELDSTFAASLEHPRLLGAFIIAEKEIALSALRGEWDAQRRIAKEFLLQFLKKYYQRQRDGHLPLVSDFAGALHGLALASQDHSGALTDILWKKVCQEVAYIPPIKAAQLFLEAASGGVINLADEITISREWTWRHPFVARYLREGVPEEFLSYG